MLCHARVLAVALALAAACSACKPGKHPPPPELPSAHPIPDSQPPTPHDEKLFEGGDAGIR